MLIILLSGDIDEDEPNIQQAALGTAAVDAGTLDTVEEPPLAAADDTALQYIVAAGLGATKDYEGGTTSIVAWHSF